MQKPNNIRVGVFVDALNILYGFREFAERNGIGKVVDFKKILRECVGDRHLVRAIAYSGKNALQGKSSFAGLNAALHLADFEVKTKKVDILGDGQIKCNWDVGMAIDIPKIASRLDVVVLVTGDGDFVDLVEELQKNYHCEVEVLAFERSLSQNLKCVSNRCTTIEQGDFLKSSTTQAPRLKTHQEEFSLEATTLRVSAPSASIHMPEQTEEEQGPAGTVSGKNTDTNRMSKKFPDPNKLQNQILEKSKP